MLGSILVQHVSKNFVKRFRLHGLLNEMASSPLECRKNILLIANRRDHHHTRVRMLLHDPLDGFDSLHLRHGDVHQNHVGIRPGVLRNGRTAVASFADNLAAKSAYHLRNGLSREHRIVHDEIANGLAVLLSPQGFKRFHEDLLLDGTVAALR